jgi:hypothetical protein
VRILHGWQPRAGIAGMLAMHRPNGATAGATVWIHGMDLCPALLWASVAIGLVLILRLIGRGIQKVWDVTRPSEPGPDERPPG